jgi:hypothetical protein
MGPTARRFLLLVAGLALLVVQGAGATPASAAAPSPAGDAFYTPPNPLPAGAPGDVIRFRPSAFFLDPLRLQAAPADVWQVLYRSTTALGQPTAISGTVLVPRTPVAGPRPIVAYASGTQGWGDQCAPSKEMAGGTYDEAFAVSNLLNRGWAVVVTDYPGLGTPGDETYSAGIPEGYAVLDALRAASRLGAAGLSRSAPMAIEGYSQGGGAADWAAQLQPAYAPELRLAGVAGGGTPANLQAVAANINGSLFFAFLAGSAIGFNAAYPALDLPHLLNDNGRAALARLDTECQLTALPEFAGRRIEDFTVDGSNPIGRPDWTAVVDRNNLGAVRPSAPLLQYHGLLDEVIPYGVERSLHDRYCAGGVTTRLRTYLAGHALTQEVAQGDVVGWLGDRLAGLPGADDC